MAEFQMRIAKSAPDVHTCRQGWGTDPGQAHTGAATVLGAGMTKQKKKPVPAHFLGKNGQALGGKKVDLWGKKITTTHPPKRSNMRVCVF